MFLRQSTASQEILLGPFVNDEDGNTAETGLTINASDILLFKHGAAAQASKASGGATHDAGGRYVATLDATDTDTIGNMEINVHVAGALPVRREFVVLDEAVYDVLFGTTAISTLTAAQVNTEADTALTDWGKTGFSLAATGLNLIVPADPAAPITLGTSTFPQCIAHLLLHAWAGENEFDPETGTITVKNQAGVVVWEHACTDDGTTVIGEATAP